jgi:hypothetical protein
LKGQLPMLRLTLVAQLRFTSRIGSPLDQIAEIRLLGMDILLGCVVLAICFNAENTSDSSYCKKLFETVRPE